ncbi:gcc2 and gcc3 domain-containing protein, partial [Cystoisospora suis]
GYFCKKYSWLKTPTEDSVNPDILTTVNGKKQLYSNIGSICPKGYYCSEGTTQPTACPQGYTSGLGATQQSDCYPCDPGHYCPSAGTSLPCNEGYVCYEGAIIPNPTNKDTQKGERCKEGFYCPRGSYKMLSAAGAASCTPCAAGTFCPWLATPANSSTAIKTCPVGHSCPAGTSTPLQCPAGTLQASQGSSNCQPCPKNFYCSTKGLTQATGTCFAGFYCSSGAILPAEPNLVYGEDGNLNGKCPPGYSCAGDKDPVPCPAGTYQ